MKILHCTYHDGCKMTIDFVMKSLGHEIHTQKADWNYNIGPRRAEEIWNKHKDYYNQFDLIITSDTGPLSRIFLQNNYTGKYIAYICNRFDYADQATNDCKFPDAPYYDLIRNAKYKNNVKIISYTKFEYEYAQKYRNVDFGTELIKPCSFIEQNGAPSAFPSNINKSETFFIPPYHNDTIFMNLKEKCDQLGINNYAGRYNGPSDLKGIKSIIHIPYGWQNLALWENWSLGNIYLIPSKNFLLELSKQNNFWWQDSFALSSLIESSEWYLPEHKELFIYFNNWDHLKELSKNDELINQKKQLALQFSKEHDQKTLQKWNKALTEWNM